MTGFHKDRTELKVLVRYYGNMNYLLCKYVVMKFVSCIHGLICDVDVGGRHPVPVNSDAVLVCSVQTPHVKSPRWDVGTLISFKTEN
jgi:hypothetical protein